MLNPNVKDEYSKKTRNTNRDKLRKERNVFRFVNDSS